MKKKRLIPLVAAISLVVLLIIGSIGISYFNTREKDLKSDVIQENITSKEEKNDEGVLNLNEDTETSQTESTEEVNSSSSEEVIDTPKQDATIKKQESNTTSSNSNSTNNNSSSNNVSTQNETKQTINNSNSEPKKVEIWESLGISEYDYYNSPAQSWNTVDFRLSDYGSAEAALDACKKAGEEYTQTHDSYYRCSQVNSYSGAYLGEHLSHYDLES